MIPIQTVESDLKNRSRKLVIPRPEFSCFINNLIFFSNIIFKIMKSVELFFLFFFFLGKKCIRIIPLSLFSYQEVCMIFAIKNADITHPSNQLTPFLVYMLQEEILKTVCPISLKTIKTSSDTNVKISATHHPARSGLFAT